MTYPFSGQVDPSWYDYLNGVVNPTTAPGAVDWSPNTGVFVPSPAPITVDNNVLNPIPDPAGTGKGIVPFSSLPYGYDVIPPTEDFPSGIAPRVGVNVPDPRSGVVVPDPKSTDWLMWLILLMAMEKN